VLVLSSLALFGGENFQNSSANKRSSRMDVFSGMVCVTRACEYEHSCSREVVE
jgi:hypothetical protein